MNACRSTVAIEDRAVEVLTLLADLGKYRAASEPYLIITATAELDGPTVLHLDRDFDVIAGITRQPVECLDALNELATAITGTRPSAR